MHKLYQRYMNSHFARSKLPRTSEHEWQFHCYNMIWITCSPILWIYLFLAISTSSPVYLKVIGLTSCVMTSLSPVILYFGKSIVKSFTFSVIFSFIYQYTFSLYSGGINSSLLAWNVIFPVTAGLILGIRYMLKWIIAVIIANLILIYFNKNGVVFDGGFALEALETQRIVFVFGWLMINSCICAGFLMYRDYTNKKLAHQKQEIEQLVRLLCHDISNPLTVIQIVTQKIEKMYPEADEKIFKKAKNAILQISEIINNVRLLQSNIDQDINLKLEPFFVNETIIAAVENFDMKAQEKNITFKIDLKNSEGLKVAVNRQLLISEVFSNLISNAIKFSEPHHSIDISTYIKDKNIVIEIRDYGIGIPPRILENLFDVKAVKQRKGTQGEQGTGYGMPLVKSCLQKMRGTIDVVSSESQGINRGTTFRVMLAIVDNVQNK